MTARPLPLLLVAVALCAACATPSRITVDHEPGADFTVFRTWAFLPSEPRADGTTYDPGEDGLLQQRIQRALEQVLPARGLVRADADHADLLVATHVTTETRLSVRSTGPAFGYSQGYRHWGYRGPPGGETTVSEYEYGTLIIDLVDRSDMTLVWRGTSGSRVRRSGTPEQREQRVREAVEGLLARFPPSDGD